VRVSDLHDEKKEQPALTRDSVLGALGSQGLCGLQRDRPELLHVEQGRVQQGARHGGHLTAKRIQRNDPASSGFLIDRGSRGQDERLDIGDRQSRRPLVNELRGNRTDFVELLNAAPPQEGEQPRGK
jgi:hypothetical protein